MILEDFFTLSEMKDGLGSLSRVKELMSVMREQRDCNVSNAIDAFRQWSTVAKILAATENKDCLKCFIQFDGLWYLNHWLQEAQKHGSDGCDDSIRKLINYILVALDRLPINMEALISSQLGLTLRHFICDTDVFLKEKGRNLLGKWEFAGEVKDHGLQKHGSWHLVELKANASLIEEGVQAIKATTSLHSISSSKVAVDGGVCGQQSAEKIDHTDAKICQLNAEVACTGNMANQHGQHSVSNSGGATVVSGDMNSLASSNVSNPCQENMSIAEESSACFVARTSSGATNSSAAEKIVIVQSDFSDIKDMPDVHKDDGLYMRKAETDLFKSKLKEESVVTSCTSLSSSILNHVLSSTELCPLNSKGTGNSSVNVSDAELNMVSVNERVLTYIEARKEENTSSGKSDGQLEAACEDSCGETSGETKKLYSSFLKADKEMDLRNQCGYSNLSTRRTEMELEFGDDALEVAVQVAIEAEREVADREQCSLSSQEAKSEGEVVESGCCDPESNKSDQLNSCACPSNLDHCDGNFLSGKNRSWTEGSPEIEQAARGHNSESPLSTSIQQSLKNAKESRRDFDLNEGVDCEDTDHPPVPGHQNLSAPVAVVATTRGSPGLPVMRSHFNGESGWRGSAATSAFRPASPKKAPEYEQISCNTEKCSIVKIDLNVSDQENDVVSDPMLTKPLRTSDPISHSSLEVSSKREERVVLDLNYPGDEDVSPEASYYASLHDQKTENGIGNQLPPSSMLAKHDAFRDIDLNDTPSAFEANDQQSMSRTSTKASSTSESRDLGDPDVVILGSRMSSVRRDPFNHSWHSSTRGFHMDTSTGLRASSMPYPCITANGYGYNGFGTGSHAMAPYQSPYGPGYLPYMVDSRGVTVIPQVFSPSSGFASAPTRRPFPFSATSNPLAVGIASSSPGSGACGSPRPLMDLNSGTFSYGSSSREYGSFGKSYVHGHGGWMEEQARHGPHAFNDSVTGLKRKEPDPNWESHAIAYKHMPSWH